MPSGDTVNQIIAVLFTIVAGISNPLQSGSNSALLKAIHAPLVAAFIVYSIGALCLLACVPFIGIPVKEAVSKLGAVPWWVYIGGVCNAIFLMSSLLITRNLGSATFTTTVVISAIVTSVALDHFGLLGFEVRPAGFMRLSGVVLAISGVLLVAKG
jgi:bacterial/archaeal transporter family-2 protein